MKAVDTNVLLRFILRDDEDQFVKSAKFLSGRTPDNPVFVSLIVLAELAWALGQRYGYSRSEVRSAVATLMEAAEIVFENETEISELVANADRGDLADHLIAYSATRFGCDSVVTFDRRAANAIPSMELLA